MRKPLGTNDSTQGISWTKKRARGITLIIIVTFTSHLLQQATLEYIYE